MHRKRDTLWQDCADGIALSYRFLLETTEGPSVQGSSFCLSIPAFPDKMRIAIEALLWIHRLLN